MPFSGTARTARLAARAGVTARRGLAAAALASLLASLAAPLGAEPAPQASAAVTVRIDMRGPAAAGWFDPATERVGVRGGAPPLSWGRTLEAADPDGDLVYEVRVVFPVAPGPAAFVPHKFKVDGAGNPGDGWEPGANRPLLLARAEGAAARAFGEPGDPYPATLTGDLRVHERFASRHVPERDVFVLLPPGYGRDARRRYPVLYLHDGQNLFDASRARGGEWQVDEAIAAFARGAGTDPPIVVGVANLAGLGRVDDYAPTRAEFGPPGSRTAAGGRAGAYGRFLVEELKPFVDRTYRTRTAPADTALGGSSLGGLATIWLGLEHPKVFGTLLVVSPSVWWDGEAVLGRVGALPRRTPQRIWLDMGTAEGEEAVSGARRLRDALAAKGWRLGRDLRYVEAEGAGHDEAAWAARFPRMLEFAFGRGR